RTFGYICQRCANQKPSLIGMFPCALCKETHAYCRHCLQMGRTMSCEPLYYWTGQPVKWPMHDDPCQWDGTLTTDQNQAANRMVQAIRHHEAELLLWAVTGSGKTEMTFPGI